VIFTPRYYLYWYEKIVIRLSIFIKKLKIIEETDMKFVDVVRICGAIKEDVSIDQLREMSNQNRKNEAFNLLKKDKEKKKGTKLDSKELNDLKKFFKNEISSRLKEKKEVKNGNTNK
jgi:hypothetical protein